MNESGHTAQMAEASKNWGIIYCPIRDVRQNWNEIRQYLEEKGVKYDFVQSEDAMSVERLAAMFARNGYRTIVVIGSDTSLNYALNGIMKTPSPDGKIPVLGTIPYGFVNDFAKFWGFDTKDYKSTIDRLVLHKTRKVDVGVAVGTLEGQEAHPEFKNLDPTQYFLNCLNIGVVASIAQIKRKTRRFLFLSLLSYLTSAIILLFQRMNFKIAFSTGGEHFCQRVMTICVGSARGYGQTPSAVPYNGQLDVSQVSPPQLTQLFHGMWLLFSGRFLSHSGIKVWRTKQIEFQELGHAPISLDSRVMPRNVSHLKVTIMEEAIEFMI